MKTAFIARALTTFNTRVIAQMQIAAKRAGIGVTGAGLQSLAYQVYNEGEGGGKSKLSFKEYLRMVDMGAGRGHPLGGLTTTKVTLQLSNKSGFAQVKDKTRKPKTFLYSKIAYGNLTGLQNELLYGYTEEAIEELKKAMQTKTP
jgi:hypothetical protein